MGKRVQITLHERSDGFLRRWSWASGVPVATLIAFFLERSWPELEAEVFVAEERCAESRERAEGIRGRLHRHG